MLSQREFKIDKNKEFSKWYNEVIYAADLIDNRYNVQGFIVHKPNATRALKSIYILFEDELEKDGHEPVIFPTVIPEENFEMEKEHVEGFAPELFWITQVGNETLKRKLFLRPTSETAFYQMYALWIQTFADLPLKLYQSCSVFRAEKETTPLMRGREFYWIETHDVFSSAGDARKQIKKDLEIFEKILTAKLGIALNAFERPQWDTFAGAENTYAYDTVLPDGKAFQIGTTHYLGQKFAKSFGIKFKREDGSDEFAFQTCFGPGIWRILAAIIAIHGDEKGLVFPMEIAPIQVGIVPILKAENSEKIIEYGKKLQTKLSEKFRVVLDLSNKTPGFKFNEFELKGVPIRIDVGGKEVDENSATITTRHDRKKIKCKLDEIEGTILQLGFEMVKALLEKSSSSLAGKIQKSKTLAEVKKLLANGMAAEAPFCTIGKDGAECAEKLKDETHGGKIRGKNLRDYQAPSEKDKCIVCGKKAEATVTIAKQY